MAFDLQALLRSTVSSRPGARRQGGFVLALDEADATPFRNYAVPLDACDPSTADVGTLIDAFGRERTPRVEFTPDASPRLEAALIVAGFIVDDRLALMTAEPGDAARVSTPPGTTIVRADDPRTLADVAEAQNDAYGAPPPTDADVARLVRTVARGGVVVLARAGELPVGAGMVTAAREGAAELAAVGVRPQWRRQGIATAIAGTLLEAARERGCDLVYLMAYAGEQAIYARVGFAPAGEIVFATRPHTADA